MSAAQPRSSSGYMTRRMLRPPPPPPLHRQVFFIDDAGVTDTWVPDLMIVFLRKSFRLNRNHKSSTPLNKLVQTQHGQSNSSILIRTADRIEEVAPPPLLVTDTRILGATLWPHPQLAGLTSRQHKGSSPPMEGLLWINVPAIVSLLDKPKQVSTADVRQSRLIGRPAEGRRTSGGTDL